MFYPFRASLCEKESDLCVEAYPSSANSFLWRLLAYLNSDLSIAHHSHSKANIKTALAYGIPVITVIRVPLDAISSKLLRFGGKLEESVLEYIDFHRFVYENRDKLTVLSFEEVINDTSATLRKITDETGIAFVYSDLEQAKNEVFSQLRESAARTWGSQDKVALPLPERESQKQQIKERLPNSRHLKEADALYKQIKGSIDRR